MVPVLQTKAGENSPKMWILNPLLFSGYTVPNSETPWTATCQASSSFTMSWSLQKLRKKGQGIIPILQTKAGNNSHDVRILKPTGRKIVEENKKVQQPRGPQKHWQMFLGAQVIEAQAMPNPFQQGLNMSQEWGVCWELLFPQFP